MQSGADPVSTKSTASKTSATIRPQTEEKFLEAVAQAINNGNELEFKKLLQELPNQAFDTIDKPLESGKTCVILATIRERINFLHYLVEKAEADINSQDNEGNTALHHAWMSNSLKKKEIVSTLLGLGAYEEIKNHKGNKPYELSLNPDIIAALRSSTVFGCPLPKLLRNEVSILNQKQNVPLLVCNLVEFLEKSVPKCKERLPSEIFDLEFNKKLINTNSSLIDEIEKGSFSIMKQPHSAYDIQGICSKVISVGNDELIKSVLFAFSLLLYFFERLPTTLIPISFHEDLKPENGLIPSSSEIQSLFSRFPVVKQALLEKIFQFLKFLLLQDFPHPKRLFSIWSQALFKRNGYEQVLSLMIQGDLKCNEKYVPYTISEKEYLEKKIKEGKQIEKTLDILLDLLKQKGVNIETLVNEGVKPKVQIIELEWDESKSDTDEVITT